MKDNWGVILKDNDNVMFSYKEKQSRFICPTHTIYLLNKQEFYGHINILTFPPDVILRTSKGSSASCFQKLIWDFWFLCFMADINFIWIYFSSISAVRNIFILEYITSFSTEESALVVI